MTFEKILLNEYNIHPKLEFIDLYKLTYQAVFGPKHLLKSPENAYKYLTEEWNLLNDKGNEHQLISLEFPLYRIDLNKFKNDGGNINELWESFYKTALSDKFDNINFSTYFNELKDFVLNLNDNILINELNLFLKTFDINNPREAHHSKVYIKNYNPHYRIILIDESNKKLLL